MNKFDLEERLISFSVLIVEIVKEMPDTKAGNHLSKVLKQPKRILRIDPGI
jgi:hypothetical protein